MKSSLYRTAREHAGKAGEHEPLYVTEHSVAPDFKFSDDSPLNTLPGLLFHQIIVKSGQGGEERRIIAWWKSREAFAEAWANQFSQLLGPASAPCFEGFQLSHHVRRGPLWWLKPTGIAGALALLVTFLTGLSTIQDWGYSLVAIPDCTLWTDPVAASAPRAAGEPFEIQIQVKNRHLRASSTATINPVIDRCDSSAPADGLERADEIEPYPVRVQPGKAEVQEFRFVATRGGCYVIRFDGDQEGGLAYPPRKIPSLKTTINVWDPIDQHPKVSLVKVTDLNATVSVEVRNAKPTPYGTAFEATLKNPDSVDVRPDKRSIPDAGDPLRNADFAQLSWRIPPSSEALKMQTFRLMLQEAGDKTRTKDEWKQLLARLTVRADEPDEPSSPTKTKK